MTLDDLENLIQEEEGTTLEFKERLSSSFARELVALANVIGGRILLGVRDNGTVIGVEDSNNLRARIQDIARNCDPPVQVHTEPVGTVVTVHVRESASKPVQVQRWLLPASRSGNPKTEPRRNPRHVSS